LKALFQIKNTETGKVVAGEGFENKQQAKAKRRELNGFTKEGKEILVHVVTLGPDHIRFNDEKKSVTRPSRRKEELEEEVAVA
jgi:hypothetical protein